MATPAVGGSPARRRTPWSWAAAAGSVALAGLQVGLLVRGTEPATYLVVVLVLGAIGCGLAGAGIAVRNCLVCRAIAVTLGLATATTVALLLTVGLPGAAPEPLGTSGGLAAALGVAVPALVAADAAARATRPATASRLRAWCWWCG